MAIKGLNRKKAWFVTSDCDGRGTISAISNRRHFKVCQKYRGTEQTKSILEETAQDLLKGFSEWEFI